jgi:hypothetical protein
MRTAVKPGYVELEKPKKRRKKGEVSNKILNATKEELAAAIEGQSQCKQVFNNLGIGATGGSAVELLKKKILEYELDYSDLHTMVRDKLGELTFQRMSALMGQSTSWEEVLFALGLRPTEYTIKGIRTRAKSLDLNPAIFNKKRGPKPAEETRKAPPATKPQEGDSEWVLSCRKRLVELQEKLTEVQEEMKPLLKREEGLMEEQDAIHRILKGGVA